MPESNPPFNMKRENREDGLTGSAWGDWANYTDSPLRAFEAEHVDVVSF